MHTLVVSLIFFVGLSAVGIMSTVLLTLRLRRLRHLLALQAMPEEDATVGESLSRFSPVLRQVELQARLQQGRQRCEMPEKYRFIRSLAERGVPATEIAGILNLAQGEVEQLLALARVTRRQPQGAAKASSRAKKARLAHKAKDFPAVAETVNR